MNTNLFCLADQYFTLHPELIADTAWDGIIDERNNPFICSSVVEGKGFQTISQRLVLYMVRYSSNSCVRYLFSPQAAVKVMLPHPPLIELHRHHYFELFCVLDGQLDVSMEHANKRYCPGDLCLLNQSVYHSEQCVGEYSAVYVSIHPDFFEMLISGPEASRYETFRQFARRNLSELGDEDSLDFIPVNGDAREENLRSVDNILSSMLTELLGRHTGYMDIITGYLKRLMAHLQHPDNFTCVNTQYSAGKTDICQTALAYIHQNRRKLTRQELGAALNYNCNYLADLFHRQMGLSLSAYIRDICMQEAARLLLNTDLPIHIIVSRVGYENRTAFYRHFQSKYGMTPGEFRDGR